MKKSFIILVSFFLLNQLAFSQKVEFGVKGGTDVVKIDGLAFDKGFEFGYHAGIFIHVPFNEKLGIQPEIYYGEASFKKSLTGSLDPIYNNTNLDSLSTVRFGKIHVPLLLQYNVGKKVSLQFGPKFTMISSANLKNAGSEIRDAIKKGELSAVAGIRLSLMSFRIFARYEIGLNDIGDIANDSKWKSQSIHAGIGFRIL
jgi:hypothetical protein